MATYRAIAATSQAILGLLADSVPRPEFAAARFELFQAINLQTPLDEGVSLYLYRVLPNQSRRCLPPRVGPDGTRYKPSVPIDLQYLLTAWAKSAERQQRLLGWAIRTLEDATILPSGLLNHYGPEPDTFAPGETVELFMDSIVIQDMGSLWEVARHHYQPSVVYIARMITLDSEVELGDAGLAQTRDFGMAKQS
jgi:Pvc16 N-terminal domain